MYVYVYRGNKILHEIDDAYFRGPFKAHITFFLILVDMY